MYYLIYKLNYQKLLLLMQQNNDATGWSEDKAKRQLRKLVDKGYKIGDQLVDSVELSRLLQKVEQLKLLNGRT